MKDYYLHNLIANPLDTTIAAACLIFGGVFDRFPELKIILAHMGGFTPWIRGRWRHGYDVRKEPKAQGVRSPDDYLGKFFYDTVIHDADCFEFAVNIFGADQILYGTDCPWDVGCLGPAREIPGLSRIEPANQEKILFSNAQKLFRL
jgi:aminocarboxymuconate-semialdehyde decarboxylase